MESSPRKLEVMVSSRAKLVIVSPDQARFKSGPHLCAYGPRSVRKATVCATAQVTSLYLEMSDEAPLESTSCVSQYTVKLPSVLSAVASAMAKFALFAVL